MKPMEPNEDYDVPNNTIWQRFIVLGEALVQLQKDAAQLQSLFKTYFDEFSNWVEKFKIMNNAILEIEKIPGMALDVERRLLISEEMAQMGREIMPVIQNVVESRNSFYNYAFSLTGIFNEGVIYIKEKDRIREIDNANRENKLAEMAEALESGKEQYNKALHQYALIKESMNQQIKLYNSTVN